MARGRRKVTGSEATELVSAWRLSQQSLPDWCAAHGIDGRSLRYWADRLSSPTTIRMVEVTVPVPPMAPALRVSLDDLTIEVPDGFTAETLVRVLAVVRGC